MLELKKQPVPAGGRERRREGNRLAVRARLALAVAVLGRMDVQERQVTFAQRDEVPTCAEYGSGCTV